MPKEDTAWEEKLFQEIVGEQLSSVEFVQDYVQLRFDGPFLTAVTQPMIEVQDRKLHWDDPCFRDELCKRISKRVIAARIVPGDSVQVEFEDRAVVKVSLKNEDYKVPEAAI